MKKKSLTAAMAEREKQKNEAPGHGWHSAAYHRHFEGWAEIERRDEQGHVRIERVYRGTWYIQSLSRAQRIAERAALAVLLAASLALFAIAALRPAVGNTKWFLALGQFAVIAAALYTLTGLFNYLTCSGKMTVGEYKGGPVRFRRGGVVMIAALLLCVLLYVLCAFLYEAGIGTHLLCAALCLSAALLLALAHRLDANVPYDNEESEESADPDAVEIE